MAIFRGSIRSETLCMDTTVNIIIPEAHYEKPLAPEKTLILLHGLKQNADAWVRMSCVETYAHYTGFNIIIPEVQRSFYTDMAYGLNYFTYITDELPRAVGKMFRIPVDREHLYVAGLSMGGYGAMKCALACPNRFAGAMSFSGALFFVDDPMKDDLMDVNEIRAIMGMNGELRDEISLHTLLKKAAGAEQKPKLYAACGNEDFLIDMNREFAREARALGFDLLYEEWPGVHDWFFWDRAAARSMAIMSGLPVQQVNPLDTKVPESVI